MKALLSARNLGCALDGKNVLEAVDLDLFAGELVGVVGPNGSGKSTLLQCLNGTRASTGTVSIAGQPLDSLTPRAVALSVALMHQSTTVDFPFSARQVVMLGRHPHRTRFAGESSADRRIVEEALVRTGSGPLADQAVNRMSGGERQRVLFSKILAQDAPVLLLDEPTASLDLSFQEQIFATAREETRAGKAVLVAVHDLRLAARHCDRLVLLARGQVLVSGTPREVLTPEHLSAAFGVRVRVYDNPVTGLPDYHFTEAGEATAHVHVIGGGGSASEILRLLGGNYRVTAGVLAPGDSDLQVASVYGISVVTCPPFSPIPAAAVEDNGDLVARADLTIVSNLAFGAYNLANLESALGARKLVVIEDDPPETRDFTAGEGLALYRRLTARATVLTESQLKDWLERWSEGRA